MDGHEIHAQFGGGGDGIGHGAGNVMEFQVEENMFLPSGKGGENRRAFRCE